MSRCRHPFPFDSVDLGGRLGDRWGSESEYQHKCINTSTGYSVNRKKTKVNLDSVLVKVQR